MTNAFKRRLFYYFFTDCFFYAVHVYIEREKSVCFLRAKRPLPTLARLLANLLLLLSKSPPTLFGENEEQVVNIAINTYIFESLSMKG